MIVRPAQANLPRQIVKRTAHCGTLQAAAVIIEKETGSEGPPKNRSRRRG